MFAKKLYTGIEKYDKEVIEGVKKKKIFLRFGIVGTKEEPSKNIFQLFIETKNMHWKKRNMREKFSRSKK